MKMNEIRDYMISLMRDSAHDYLHVLRVRDTALAIAQSYPEADIEILEAAALLHDIGRAAQFETGADHASVGAKMALDYLLSIGWEQTRADWVSDCVRAHRFRSGDAPQTIEAKILFDADKLDVVGAIGIARTLMYQGRVGHSLYTLNSNGEIDLSARESFLGEYEFKLKRAAARLITPEAQKMARSRGDIAREFRDAIITEAGYDLHKT